MPGPLKGFRILDFTTLLPGPFATMVLADLGADVLKVVSRSRPDLAEVLPPFLPGTNISSATAMLNRGKRSLALNLKDPRAAGIIHRLLDHYDIVIEQFRPGVMEKLGLGYDSLKAVNPALIYCSITGYGQTGPLRDRAGHDINYLCRSGLMAYSGRKKNGPTLLGTQIADIVGGSNNAVIGILAAVIHRQQAGEGQFVDVSMTDGMVALQSIVAGAFLVDGKEQGREENMLNGGSLYDFYETADGGYISFGGIEPQFFGAFCKRINRREWIAGGIWPKNLLEVKGELCDLMKTKTRDEWAELFADIDACLEPVLSLPEALNDRHIQARGMVIDVPSPEGGTIRQIAHPVKYSKTAPGYSSIGKPGGEDTTEVLLGLGYTEEELVRFEKTGLFR